MEKKKSISLRADRRELQEGHPREFRLLELEESGWTSLYTPLTFATTKRRIARILNLNGSLQSKINYSANSSNAYDTFGRAYNLQSRN